MQCFNESIRVKHGIRILFFIGASLCSLLGWFLFTPILYGHPANAKALAGTPTGRGSSLIALAIPVAPSNLTVNPVSYARIDLAWIDNSNNESGFTIERKTPGSTYTEIAVLGANVKSLSDSSLSANTMYFYRVRAYNTSGFSDYANEATAKTLPKPPAAPSHLTAQRISTTQINLTWTDNSANESGFKIERKIGAVGKYAEIANVGANVTSYSDNGLTENTTYFYRVRAFNAGGASAYSNEAGAATLPNPPVAPGKLRAATISQSQINLAWTDSSNNEDGFKIERKTLESIYTQIATVSANVTSYSDLDLEQDTEYFYRVRAYNSGGASAYSNEVNIVTLPIAPATPGSLKATTKSSSQIDLAWADSSNNEVSFKIERKIPQSADTFAEITTVGMNVTSYSNLGLISNTKYFYRVRAYNLAGHSAYSNVTATTTLPRPPAAPSGLVATPKLNLQIELAWQDKSTDEDNFKIERKKGAAGTYVQIAMTGANVKKFADSSLAANTAYFYRLRASNTGGHSDYAREASATTLPKPPAAPPGGLTATTMSNTRINLAWQDKSTNEDNFKIERKKGAAGTYVQIAMAGANVKKFADSSLAANTAYFYRLRASNTGGHSDYSNEASTTTLPDKPAAPPGGLTATTVSNSQINLAWQDKATNEEGFAIERKAPQSGGTYAEVVKVGANVTSYSDNGLAANTAYFYRLRAFNARGASAYSNEANATTFPNPPAAPGKLTATPVSDTQIDLAWQDRSTNEDSFKIERKIGTAGKYVQIAKVGQGVTSYSNTGLNSGPQYFYRVRASNTGGASAYSNEANATILFEAPMAPGSLTATSVSPSKILLAWTDRSNNESGFKIERKIPQSGSVYAEIATVGANVTSYSELDLISNTKYFYRVRAYNLGGHSAYSNAAAATTLPTPPAAPGGLVATPMLNLQIELVWQDQSTDEDSFKVERKIGGSAGSPNAGAYAQIATLGANATSYTDSGLKPLTTYWYRVRASNNVGPSDYSNEANAIISFDAPTAPVSLTATLVSNCEILLAWADSSNNETGFKIERKIPHRVARRLRQSGGAYAEIATVAANVTAYSDLGLEPDTEYFYRVRAYNANGHSDYSNEVNAKNFSIAPLDLTTELIPANAIWKYNAGGTNLGTSWKETSYNDSSWLSGQAGLGFGESYINTILPSNQSTYYFRKSFTLAGPVAVINQLSLSANYDDGFVAYLNGQEVARQAMPAGTISYNTLASLHEGGKYETIDLSAHLNKLVFGNNILAVEVHQNIPTSNDLVMDMKLEYRTPRITRGPYLQSGGATQMAVRWRTDFATTSRVQYGTDPCNLSLVTDDPAVTTEHEVKLTGLAPGTKYYYAVGTKDIRLASGNDFYFVTTPAAGRSKKTRLWVLGDAGTTTADQIAVREAYYNFTGTTPTDLWVMLGDNAYGSGTDKEYQAAVFDMYPTMLRKSVLWPAFGNHDAGSASSAPPRGVFYNIFTLPAQGEAGGAASGTEAYYAFDFANIHFICLNSEDIPRATTGAMLTWLQQDLAANNKPWTIAFWHHPPYTKGSHDSDAETPLVEMRQNALPILENGGVDLVLTGHSHSYERTFLLDGHYGASGTLTSKMILDSGNGRVDGDGAYSKPTLGPSSHQGAVYVVAGSSGKISGGSLDHPAMYVSLNVLGSVVMDVDSNRVEVTFLDQLGKKRDYFTVIKGAAALSAPGNLTATAINSGQINLSWTDHSNDEDGFKIERKAPQSGGKYAVIVPQGGIGANVTSYADTGLVGGTNYFYRVRAYNASGNSAYSNEAAANLALNKPAAALSAYGSNTPNQAIDGSASTFWRSGKVGINTSVWWRADLGAGYSINRVVIKWQKSYYAKDYQIQVSNDDAAYNTVYTDNAGNGGADEVTFTPASGRYVRIYMTKNSGASERLDEVEVYGGASAALNKAARSETSTAAIPDEITLAQNYPNPFWSGATSRSAGNPSTTISYSLPAGMHVTLNVVNLNGQIVTKLANSHHARGVYHVRFDASNLPSGIYFAILKAGKVTKVQRMLFMK